MLTATADIILEEHLLWLMPELAMHVVQTKPIPDILPHYRITNISAFFKHNLTRISYHLKNI